MNHVDAVQGSTDPNGLFVWVTWTWQPGATSFNVYRDDSLLTTVNVTGDRWDKCAYRDATVSAGLRKYQVSAVVSGAEQPRSDAVAVYVRASTAAKTFYVANQTGATTRDKLIAARDAAIASNPTWFSPAVVYFPNGTWTFDVAEGTGALFNNVSNVVVRGQSRDGTILRAGFAGSTSPGGVDGVILRFLGGQTTLANTVLANPIAVGDSTVTITAASAAAGELRVGDIIAFEQLFLTPEIIDPGTGADNHSPWDANEIMAISGQTVTFRYPFSQAFTTAVPFLRITGSGCGIENLTVEGESSTTQTFYTLLDIDHTVGFHLSQVRGRWANRNVARVRGYRNALVELRITEADPKTDTLATDISRYKVTNFRSANLRMVGCDLGDDDRLSSSLLTTQFSQRQLVRHCIFRRSENYAMNEHGGGSRHWVWENCRIYGPEMAKAGVFLGNVDFGPSGPGVLRNVFFDRCTKAVAAQENSYEARIFDCLFRDCTSTLIDAYGWAGPDTAPDLYGSLRWTVLRNRTEHTGTTKVADGFLFGRSAGKYPYPGTKDLLLGDNHLDVAKTAIRLGGSSAETNRFQVYNNSGKSSYARPRFIAGDYWAGNADASPTPFEGFSDDFTTNPARASGASIDNNWIWLPSHETGITQDPLVSTAGAARISIFSSATTERQGYCLRPEALGDANVTALLRYFTTTNRRYGLAVRHGGGAWDSDSYYLEVAGQGTERVKLVRRVDRVATVLATSTAFDANGDGNLKARLEATGSTIRAKVWLATNAEPAEWTISVVDGVLPGPGLAGFYAWGQAGVSHSIDHDDFALTGTSVGVAFGTSTDVDWDAEFFAWQSVAAFGGASHQLSFAESAPATDSLARQIDAVRSFGDAAPATDLLERRVPYSRALTDLALLSESVEMIRVSLLFFSESAPASESLQRSVAHVRDILERARAEDSLYVFVPPVTFAPLTIVVEDSRTEVQLVDARPHLVLVTSDGEVSLYA